MTDKYATLRFDVEKVDAVRSDVLEVIDYEYPGQPVEVEYWTDEFTSVCPRTGLPDIGSLYIRYVPGEHLIELESLKYYLLTFRNVGILQEHVAARILKDLMQVCEPSSMTVEADFALRGGLGTRAKAQYDKKTHNK